MKEIIVSPSILAADFLNLGEEIKKLKMLVLNFYILM